MARFALLWLMAIIDQIISAYLLTSAMACVMITVVMNNTRNYELLSWKANFEILHPTSST